MTTFILTNKNREKASIVMLVSFMGKKYKKSIGCSIPDKLWSDTKKRVKITSTSREYTYINDIIDKWEEAANEAMVYFLTNYSEPPSSVAFFDKVSRLRFNDKTEIFVRDYFNTFIERYQSTKSKSRIKIYKRAKKLISRYETDMGINLRFEDINIDFYNSFSVWFYNFGYSANYFGTFVKVIKMLLLDARDIDHLHSSNYFQNKSFVAPTIDVDNIYLTEEELLKLYNLEITPESIVDAHEDIRGCNIERKVNAYRRAKDLFLIGAFTGLRYSDFSKINKKNISDNKIIIETQKTKTKVVIPIHWVVREIIDSGYDFSFSVHPQKMNNYIKDMARMAGIDKDVLIRRNIGGKNQSVTRKKYELVCTHTARRSFATNAYKSGIPTIAIMKITGHRSEKAFLKYIKITEEENAEMLLNSPFFKK